MTDTLVDFIENEEATEVDAVLSRIKKEAGLRIVKITYVPGYSNPHQERGFQNTVFGVYFGHNSRAIEIVAPRGKIVSLKRGDVIQVSSVDHRDLAKVLNILEREQENLERLGHAMGTLSTLLSSL
jgi:hypothetical protein